MMKRSIAVFAATMWLGSAAYAYQVTGPVLDVTDSKIVVEKDKERWELARDKDTKGDKSIKKGDRVTIQYNMTATSIEVKDAKGKDAKGKDAKGKDAKKEDAKDSKAPAKK